MGAIMEDRSNKGNQSEDTTEWLKSENFRLKSIIENLPGSIYWKDKNGVYLGRNTYSMEKMQSVELEHGRAKDAVIGKTDYDFFSKEVADRYRKHDLAVMRAKKELSLEEPVTLPNGKTIIQLSTKRPFYNAKGKVAGIVGNTIDVTHMKEVETELRQAKEKAEQANLIKTEFMRNMEHDIRTPFSGVLGFANILYDMEEDTTKKGYLGDIAQCAKELLDYCNSILDFSKIESRHLPILEKKFDLVALIDSVIKIEKPGAKYKKLEFNLNHDKNIPAILIGDSYRLHRILINIISNAIKFTKKGHVDLTISLCKKTHRTILIRFTVTDTGIGIPDDKQEYIFEKFTRLSLSNKGLYKGIGLGLRVVKQFMYEMGGEIDVLSEVGNGTQFICTIPFNIPLTNDFVDNEIKGSLND